MNGAVELPWREAVQEWICLAGSFLDLDVGIACKHTTNGCAVGITNSRLIHRINKCNVESISLTGRNHDIDRKRDRSCLTGPVCHKCGSDADIRPCAGVLVKANVCPRLKVNSDGSVV